MTTARLFAFATGISALLATLAPVPAHGATIVSASGLPIGAGEPKQIGRLARSAPTDACNTFGIAPVSEQTGLQFSYRLHTGRSVLNEAVCLTVQISTTCTAVPNQIHSASYIPAFVPTAIEDNFAGDPSTIGGGSASYSFTVPAGSSFATVVNEFQAGQGCGGYNLTWSIPGPWATSRPTLASGSPALGSAVTAAPAAWALTPAPSAVVHQWRRCDPAGAACVDIAGATGLAYTVTEADLGGTLRLRSIATDAGGTSSSDSLPLQPYIPLGGPATGSFAAGDKAQSGFFVRDGVESRCAAPTTQPTILNPASLYLYDEYPVTSLINEPTCLVLETAPDTCVSGVVAAIHSPSYSGVLTEKLAGSSGGSPAARTSLSWELPAGMSAVGVATAGPSGGGCAAYTAALGTTTPFATERPAVTGAAVEGGTLSTTNGTWTGTPAFAQSWLRCDSAGNACVPIPGAGGSTYAPTAADAGSRARARVTASRGTSASSDSAPSEVIAAAPPVEPPAPPGGGATPVDRLAPRATLKLKSRDARRALRRARLPVAATCNENCSLTVDLVITSKLAKKYKLGKRVVIGAARSGLTAGRGRTLDVKLTRLAKKRLGRVKTLKVTVRATARDAARNTGTASKKTTLRRAR